jgi:hypothetical protein
MTDKPQMIRVQGGSIYLNPGADFVQPLVQSPLTFEQNRSVEEEPVIA